MAVTALPEKDKAIITASYGLNVAESRVILLAITVAKEYQLTSDFDTLLGKRIEISATRYVDMFGIPDQPAYRVIQDACRTLFKRQFSYTESAENTNLWHRTSHWVIDIAYMNEVETVALSLTPTVIAFMDELEERLKIHNVQKIANLTNAHTILLYELLTTLHYNSKAPRIGIKELRKELGILDHEYKRMFDFKRQVLDFSIEQINEHTDIKISYKQHRKVRTINAFTFTIDLKKIPLSFNSIYT